MVPLLITNLLNRGTNSQEKQEADQSLNRENRETAEAKQAAEEPKAQEVEVKAEEPKVKAEQSPKAEKRYVYAACGMDGTALRREDRSLYFQTVVGETLPTPQSWPEEIRSKVQVSRKFRVELKVSKENPDKEELDEFKEQAKEQARKDLRRMADEEDKAHEARQMEKQSVVPQSKSESAPEAISEIVPEAETVSKTDIQSEKPCAVSSVPAVDSKKILDQIQRSKDALNQDHMQIMDSLEDMQKKTNDQTKAAKREIKDLIKTRAGELETNAQKSAVRVARDVEESVRRETGNIVKQVDDMARDIDEKQDKLLSKTGSLTRQIDELGESVQSMEGSLKKLKQLDKLDRVTELLQSKGMVITMDIPPVNAEEEDIANLVRYSQKITEQLGYAARELLRKRDAFRSQEENNANEQKAMTSKIMETRVKSFQEGQLDVVRKLLWKYMDIDTVRKSENFHARVIWTLLKDLGVGIDGEGRFEKGQEVQISEEEAQKMLAVYSGVDGAGKYQVTKTGLVFRQEILIKAEFARVPEQPEESSDCTPEQNEAGSDTV